MDRQPFACWFSRFAIGFAMALAFPGAISGAEIGEPAAASPAKIYSGASCLATDRYFENDVWPKVGAQSCLECHKEGGEAEDSDFILRDPAKDPDPAHGAFMRENRAAFTEVAKRTKGGQSRLLLKAIGSLDHGGEDVLKPDSKGYRVLAEFVRRTTGPQEMPLEGTRAESASGAKEFFEGVAMLDQRRLLRRLTLSLGARLPTAAELEAVNRNGLDALGPILDGVMKEDAFYERLAEAFNDIFLTRGYDDGAESALAYDYFEKSRLWYQKFDLDHISDPKARKQAGYKLADDYRESLLREPLELIKYIVRNDRPFSEIVNADYIMVSPYSARGYGVFEEVCGQFRDLEDPYEYVPVRLKALKDRAGKVQESETGYYPHAGMLSIFQYLRRYPTTETNRNRLRSRMYYQHFLGVDVLELAARVSDAAAVTAKYEIPTMQAPECVVCHRTLDPVAGIFQDYYSLTGAFGPRKDGWFKDMFVAGLEGEDLPPEQRWRSLQWLAERTVRDPRFATTMVEHVYYVLTGRRALLRPKMLDDALFDAKARAYQAQRKQIERIAAQFVKSNFDLKGVFKAWAVSPFYRADALTTATKNPEREAELADVGVARMLGPEQLERKVKAIFGKPWGRLKDKELSLLYGGIDSQEVTDRAADPSGAMGALQRTLANEVACKNVPLDFSLERSSRRLFPTVDPDVLPGQSNEADQQLHSAMAHLHELILGRYDEPTSAEVQRTFDLFAGVMSDAQARGKEIEPLENYSCRVAGEQRIKDTDYTYRAWRAVVTYLLRQREFLYE